MRTVSIDPGKNNIGLAVWHDALLVKALLIKTADIFDVLPQCNVVVIEKMQVYRGSVSSALIDLSIVGGEIAGAMRVKWGAKPIYYLPKQWKGQAPKDVVHARLENQLLLSEKHAIQLLRNKKLNLDILDAVALGLKHFEKTGVRFGKTFPKRPS